MFTKIWTKPIDALCCHAFLRPFWNEGWQDALRLQSAWTFWTSKPVCCSYLLRFTRNVIDGIRLRLQHITTHCRLPSQNSKPISRSEGERFWQSTLLQRSGGLSWRRWSSLPQEYRQQLNNQQFKFHHTSTSIIFSELAEWKLSEHTKPGSTGEDHTPHLRTINTSSTLFGI